MALDSVVYVWALGSNAPAEKSATPAQSPSYNAYTLPQEDIVAWGKSDGTNPPEKIHVPYWSKKSNNLVTVLPLHVWHNSLFSRLPPTRDAGSLGVSPEPCSR